MLSRNRIVVASLIITIVLASLMFISPVKAETYRAEMPPYQDKWALASGSNYPYADANLTTGRMVVLCQPLTNEYAAAHVKTWKRVWLPAMTLEITFMETQGVSYVWAIPIVYRR